MADPTRDLLRELVALRKSGGSSTFIIDTDDVTTSLGIKGGEIVSVEASKPGEPLGRLLIRKRMFTQDQYVDVLERMSSALAVGEKVRFGELAVELGYATEENVRECLNEQVRGLAARAFMSAAPKWTISDLRTGRDTGSMHVETIFLEAMRWVDDARKNALALDEARSRALGMTWELSEIDERFDLSPGEAELVRTALAGDKTVAELLEESAPDAVDRSALITALLASGAAVSRSRVVFERHEASTYAASKPPPALPEWASVDASRAKNALAKIVLAKKKVDTERPSPLSAIDSLLEQALRAEQAALRGKELFRTGDKKGALADFERAIELAPDSIEFGLFVAWMRHASSGKKLTPEIRADLKRSATSALQKNAMLAVAFYVLAQVNRAEGRIEESRKNAMHALRLEPDLFGGAADEKSSAANVPAGAKALDVSDLTGAVASDDVEVAVDDIAEVVAPDEPKKDAPKPEPPKKPEVPKKAADPKKEDAPKKEEPKKEEPKKEEPKKTAESKKEEPKAAPKKPAAAQDAPSMPSSGARFAIGCIVAGLLVVAYFVYAGSSSQRIAPDAPVPPPVPTAAKTNAVDAAVSAVATSVDASSVASARVPAAAPDAAASVTPMSAGSGVILLPSSAIGHRVFLDGRLVGTAVERFVVPCGRHEVRIGSSGAPRTVEIACAGTTDLR